MFEFCDYHYRHVNINIMKTKILILVLAAATLISFGASRISNSRNEKVQVAQNNEKGPIGGFAAEDK